MNDNRIPKIHESEYRFCLILWETEPITCSALAKLCKEKLGWSRTTTYTVIKRLSERGVVKSENGTVTSLISKELSQSADMEELIEKRFEGSLPAFIAAFARKQRMSREEYEALKELIEKGGK